MVERLCSPVWIVVHVGSYMFGMPCCIPLLYSLSLVVLVAAVTHMQQVFFPIRDAVGLPNRD